MSRYFFLIICLFLFDARIEAESLSDHEKAIKAVNEGEILPLDEILKKISEKFLDEKFLLNNKEGYYLWKREINMRLIYLQKNIEKELLNQKKEKEASKEEKNNLL